MGSILTEDGISLANNINTKLSNWTFMLPKKIGRDIGNKVGEAALAMIFPQIFGGKDGIIQNAQWDYFHSKDDPTKIYWLTDAARDKIEAKQQELLEKKVIDKPIVNFEKCYSNDGITDTEIKGYNLVSYDKTQNDLVEQLMEPVVGKTEQEIIANEGKYYVLKDTTPVEAEVQTAFNEYMKDMAVFANEKYGKDYKMPLACIQKIPGSQEGYDLIVPGDEIEKFQSLTADYYASNETKFKGVNLSNFSINKLRDNVRSVELNKETLDKVLAHEHAPKIKDGR